MLAVDTKKENGIWKVYQNGGKISTDLDAVNWAKKAEELGAGEILLTSINNDGTKSGFSLDITKAIANSVNIPVIASGGAGKMEDFTHLFQQTKATGALAASVFHYGQIKIPELKQYLKTQKINVR